MEKLRIYTDTSVIGGYFDKEFELYSKIFFKSVINGNFKLILSDITFKELNKGPIKLINLIKTIPDEHIEYIKVNNDIVELAQKYLDNKIVSVKYRDDALHVATATITRVDAIVSWNFRHIVRFDKIKSYNFVNITNGYGLINIITPMELYYEGKN